MASSFVLEWGQGLCGSYIAPSNVKSIKFQEDFFWTRQLILKYIWQYKGLRVAKMLKKEDKLGEPAILDIKI